MLITRRLVRTLALALPLVVVAYPQAMIHYGAAVTAGSAAGAAAGKGASDALTRVMNTAAAAGETGKADEVAAAEARMAKEAAAKQAAKEAKEAKEAKSTGKPLPEDPTPASEYRSVVKPANMASGGAPAAGPSGAVPAKGKGARQGKETALVASAATLNVSPISGKPIARTRRGTAVSAVEPLPVEPEIAEAAEIEIPASMQWELASLHPVLEPLGDRLQRIAKGQSRADVKRILGNPASKVTIPAERDVTEIYYYQEKGRNVGIIRLEAGEVTKINLDSL